MAESLHVVAAAAGLAVVVAVLARWRGIGVALPLVGLGVLLSIIPIGPSGPKDPEFFLVVVLAPLVFGEALSTSYLDIRRVSRPVLALAIGLVVVSAFVVGTVAAHVVGGMPFAVALCLGAVLGPTDAVAVSAVARSAGLPRRLVTILEGESLVNDGTALTLLRVAVAAAVAGSVTAGDVAITLTLAVLGGVLVGLLGGGALAYVMRHNRDTVASNSLLLVAPFPLYLIAEEVHGSGILAVVVAGLLIAHGTASDPRFRGRAHVGAVWRQITFVLQAMAFALVGIELPDTLGDLSDAQKWQALELVAVIAVVLAVTRLVFVAGMIAVESRRDPAEPIGWRGGGVLAWAGARGPVSALAAFSLPLTLADGSPFPDRSLVLAVTVGVVVVTLMLAPTLRFVAKALAVAPDDDEATRRRVSLSLARAALDRLEEITGEAERTGDPLPEGAVRRLREGAMRRLERATELADAPGEAAEPSVTATLAREMLLAEQEELVRMRDEDGLPDAMVRSMLGDLDVRTRALGS